MIEQRLICDYPSCWEFILKDARDNLRASARAEGWKYKRSSFGPADYCPTHAGVIPGVPTLKRLR